MHTSALICTIQHPCILVVLPPLLLKVLVLSCLLAISRCAGLNATITGATVLVDQIVEVNG